MSSAKMKGQKETLCLHIRLFLALHFHRAKPDSEMERSGIELSHCGVAKRTQNIYKAIHPTPSASPFS